MAKKSPAAAPAAPAIPTRCDQGGPEMNVGIISLHQGDPVDLNLVLCKAAFDVRVFLDAQLLVRQVANDGLQVTLPPLAAGFHTLTWTYLAAGTPWQVRSDVLVNGVVRFRIRKGDPASDMASNNIAIFLEVL